MAQQSTTQTVDGDQIDQDSGKGATATVVRPIPVRPRIDRLPPWNVLLHNDDHNDVLDVVLAIRQLTSLNTQDATRCMLEAHTRGLSLLMVTHREHAELLSEQFASKKLTVTIEPSC